ncbi:MAG: acyltransferase [bacterium]
MPAISHTSVIAEDARIGPGAEIGHFCVVGEGVSVGPDCRIGHHVCILPGSSLGAGVRVDEHTVIGKSPMAAARSAITQREPAPPCEIGDRVLIGASAVVYAGCRIGRDVLLADFVSVRENVEIGDFTIVGRGVAVENKCRIGRCVKIETEAYITALSEIGDYCFISPEVTFTNDNFMGRTKERFQRHKGVTLRRGARVGANATVLPGVVLGEDSVVAAGSIVTADVPARKIVLGAPARVWRDVPESHWVENNFEGAGESGREA